MKQILKKILSLSKLTDRIYNRLVLRYKKIVYESYPLIEGRLSVINNGKISLGKAVRFCSSPASNYVGLYKRCSIAVMPGAVLQIGHHSGFSGVSIYCANKIIIGDYVNIGGNVCIWDTDFHPLPYLQRRQDDQASIQTRPIIIGDDVFIGANSIVLKGVSIGSKSIIGAGSVVTKPVPEGEIWAGNPARFIRKIDEAAKTLAPFHLKQAVAI